MLRIELLTWIHFRKTLKKQYPYGQKLGVTLFYKLAWPKLNWDRRFNFFNKVFFYTHLHKISSYIIREKFDEILLNSLLFVRLYFCAPRYIEIIVIVVVVVVYMI
jgi:hypothetical protein